ncbi:hypothetical protein I7I50_03125 [Histoplasma capsulatum G186AR]|uniref:Uncharacterized protein n=1 Tax=Ajellomyces capsulatus TaxID=5037 RepID=A0A8H7Z663_AJECA|nr:hypothetical protein I7I52_00207 [Histoplasma capsulatum]QSS72069.1 hypothetical protein I7I50_03125 [Histoplasma capsulatum G186AR]
MCGRNKRRFRCGHEGYFGGINYCEKSTTVPSGRRIMCDQQRSTSMFTSSAYCGKADCLLSINHGVWDCCSCTETGNHHPLCDNGVCNHEICANCQPAR